MVRSPELFPSPFPSPPFSSSESLFDSDGMVSERFPSRGWRVYGFLTTRRAAGGPQRRRAAPLLLGGDAAVPARCKLGSALCKAPRRPLSIGANASTPYHVKLTRAPPFSLFQLSIVRGLSAKYSYGGGASSSYGQFRKEGSVQEPRARALDWATHTPTHGHLPSKLAALVVAGGSGL